MEPWPAPFMDFQDALAGSVGLRGNIVELLNWGILHLPSTQVDDPELEEAITFATQVGNLINHKIVYCIQMYST